MFELHTKNYYDMVYGGIRDANHKPWNRNDIQDFTYEEFSKLNSLFDLDFEFAVSRDELISNSPNIGGICKIFKTKDEWYYVDFDYDNGGSSHTRCDQFEGLVQCLKDKIESIEDKKMEVMKYIKTFEDIKYYKDISCAEYSIAIDAICLEPNDLEIQSIKDILIDKHPWFKFDVKHGGIDSKIDIKDLPYIQISSENYINNKRLNIEIVKSTDEWYYLFISNNKGTLDNYYKCDQFDSLLKCLKDNI